MQQKTDNNGDGDGDGDDGISGGGNGSSSSSGGSAREMGVVDLWMAFALSAAPRMRSKVTCVYLLPPLPLFTLFLCSFASATLSLLNYIP